MMLVALMTLPLIGCARLSDANETRTIAQPVVPADIQKCFEGGPIKLPARALTAGEVESLWGNDRIRIVVLQKCGKRFIAWYGAQR